MLINTEEEIIRRFSTTWAEKYWEKHLARYDTADPKSGLDFFFGGAFARTGGQQAGYHEHARNALQKCIEECGSFNELIQRQDAPDMVWKKFSAECRAAGIKSYEELNKPIVTSLVRLAQQIEDNNLFSFFGQEIRRSVPEAFKLLRDIKGIGDKIAAMLLRDIVALLNLEEEVPVQHQFLLQPIDRWVKAFTTYMWPNLKRPKEASNWLIALKIVDKCIEYSCSPCRFNQGVWMFGSSEVKRTKEVKEGLWIQKLLNE
jgi:hypothetical protein